MRRRTWEKGTLSEDLDLRMHREKGSLGVKASLSIQSRFVVRGSIGCLIRACAT
jgi:hypothetical protein